MILPEADMTVDPARWLTMFEVLEQTKMPYPDILQLADEGLLTTRRAGRIVLYDADDVRRLAATGGALASSPEVVAGRPPAARPRRRRFN